MTYSLGLKPAAETIEPFLSVARFIGATSTTKRSAVSQEIKGTTTHSRGVERTGAKAEAIRASITMKARDACIVWHN
jgi:hypothetical protein